MPSLVNKDMRSKKKTNWEFVITLMCVAALGSMMCYVGKYIDMQAQRIDYLEIENLKHSEALHILLPSAREEVKAGVSWHDMEP